jgi:hypothetical protein
MNDFDACAISRHEFDLLEPPARAHIELRRATLDDIEPARTLAESQLPDGVASQNAIARVISRNRDSILLFLRDDRIVGLWAMLMLTAQGLEQLLLGELKGANPGEAAIAAGGETPAAIYHWAVVAPKLAAEGIRHVSVFLRQPLFRRVNFYSRPNTEIGVRLNHGLGFRPIAAGMPGLFRYIRLCNRASQLDRAA